MVNVANPETQQPAPPAANAIHAEGGKVRQQVGGKFPDCGRRRTPDRDRVALWLGPDESQHFLRVRAKVAWKLNFSLFPARSAKPLASTEMNLGHPSQGFRRCPLWSRRGNFSMAKLGGLGMFADACKQSAYRSVRLSRQSPGVNLFPGGWLRSVLFAFAFAFPLGLYGVHHPTRNCPSG